MKGMLSFVSNWVLPSIVMLVAVQGFLYALLSSCFTSPFDFCGKWAGTFGVN